MAVSTSYYFNEFTNANDITIAVANTLVVVQVAKLANDSAEILLAAMVAELVKQ